MRKPSQKTPTLVELAKKVPTKKPGIKRTVTVTNNITPEMLVKKHWTGSYTPEPFAILVDGKKLEAGKTAQVTVEDDTLNVQYNYSFMNGYRKGTSEITFKVAEKQEKIGMTFSWEDDDRVIIENAKAIAKREI